MYYLHHVHAASASAQSAYLGNFLPSGPCLCRVLHTSLSFVSLANPDSTSSPSSSSDIPVPKPLTELFNVPINARILRVTPIECEGGDRLAVLTDHHQPRLLILRHRRSHQHGQGNRMNIAEEEGEEDRAKWSPIETEAVLLLDEMGRPAAESGLNVEVERGIGASYLFSHTHAGILKVAPLLDSNEVQGAELNRAFGLRLPHPHLISSTFLARQSASSPSTIALLSLSSVASRLPGLGMQCLPVLSFHCIDEANQELRPMAWGPLRKVPPVASPAPVTSPTVPKAGRQKSSCQSSSTRTESQSMPGSFDTPSTEDAPPSAAGPPTAQPSRRHGPAAMGATRTPEEERLHEEALVKAPLTRAHVPIPFADALGAHQLLSLPARAGGGVLLFSESSILHISPPNGDDDSLRSPLSSRASETASGKRRKASGSQATSSSLPRVPGGNNSSQALSTSPVSPTQPALPIRSNENGKRRRSTAGSQSQAAAGSRQQLSPTASRRSNSAMHSGMTKILRLELEKAVIVASAVVVCEPGNEQDDGVQVDEKDESKASLQVLFGTHSGVLYLFQASLERAAEGEPWRPMEITAKVVGSIPAPGGPSALTYLGENFVSVASTGGDSVLVQIQAKDVGSSGDRNESPFTLRVVHRWSNLAPILDFVVDDGAGLSPSHGKSAQARIITCSGSGPSGSLRIVRNGVSLEDVLSLDEPLVRRLWSVSSGDSRQTRLIVLAYHTHTRILSVEANGAGFEDVTAAFASAGWNVGKAVLEVASLANDAFVVVDSAGVSVWSIQQRQLLSLWTPVQVEEPNLRSSSISKAATNESGQVLISLKTSIGLLQVGPNGSLELLRMQEEKSEVSAMDISPLEQGRGAEYAVFALWKPWLVKMVRLSDWEDVTPSSLCSPQPNLIRSLLLHTFTAAGAPTSEPHLLLGLGDGTLNSHALSLPTTDSLSARVGVLEKRSALIGSQPIHLRSFETANGLRAIFVSCDRPSVVFSLGKSLQYSSVRHREVNDVCQFTVEDQALAIFAKRDELILSRMGQIQKLDVTTIELGSENPVSLAMSADTRSIAVATNDFLPEGRQSDAVQGGKVILFDFKDFARLDELRLELEERINCIEAVDLLGRSFLVVGTGFTFPDRAETTSGRIIVFAVETKRRRLRMVTTLNVEGNTYAVGAVGNFVVACVNSKVLSYEVQLDEGEGESGKGGIGGLRLLEAGQWACAFTAITLRVAGKDRLVIGDALRSIVLLQVALDSGKVHELARDCDPYWTMAAEVLDEEEQVYLGCDIGFNLWTCSRLRLTDDAKKNLQESKTRGLERGESDRKREGDETWSHILQRDAAFHYGDLINAMKRGALTSTGRGNNSSGVEPRIVFGTAAGALGVVAKLEERVARVLSQVEVNLRQRFEPLGRIPAEEWRTLRTDHRTQKSAGFIDGDFVNASYDCLSANTRTRFLQHGPYHVEAEADEINSLIESLNRLS